VNLIQLAIMIQEEQFNLDLIYGVDVIKKLLQGTLLILVPDPFLHVG
jgi:hypothetical protein